MEQAKSDKNHHRSILWVYKWETKNVEVNAKWALSTSSTEEKQIIDEVSASLSYVWFADFWSATTAAVWKIFRITTALTITTIEFADWNADYDNIWDSRGSLSYS